MNFIDKMVEHFIKLNRKMRRWRRAVSILGALVVFVTTYTLVLPAITLDKETASTQAGMEIAASEIEPSDDGTVYESQPEEEAVEEEAEAAEDEASSTESGSEEAENTEEATSEDASAEDASASEEATSEEEVTSEVVSAPEGQTSSEVAPAAEEEAEAENTEEPEAAVAGAEENAAVAATNEVAPEIELITEQTQLVYEGGDYKVYADFGEEAKLPVGVELKVKEITAESDPEAYQDYYEKTLSQMQDKYDENTTLSFAKFYDISFVYEGAEVEPAGDVKVRIEYDQPVDIVKNAAVDTVHFDKEDEKKVEVIDTEVDSEKKVEEKVEKEAVKAVEFESNQFSVYGVVGTLTTTVITADGATCKITVTYDSSANIPKNAELRVREIVEDERDQYFDEAVSMLGGDILLTNVYMWDISIFADGKEVEPAAPVKVDIEYINQLDTRGTNSFDVIHFGKNGAEHLDSELATTEEGTSKATFNADEFSVFLTATPASTNATKAGGLRAAAAPEHHKTLEENSDGTYTLSLNVKGSASSDIVNPHANIIIVVDASNSMINNNAPSGGTRLANTINNLSDLALALLEDNTTANPDNVEIALVQFNDTSTTLYDPTVDKDKFSVQTLTNTIQTHQGTNYEAAMDQIRNVTFKDNDPKYVVFLTDGEPTRVVTDWNVITNGNNANYINQADMVSYFGWVAAQKAKALKDEGYEFYGIYAYGREADYLDDLVSYAYGRSYGSRTFQYRYNNGAPWRDYTTWDAEGATGGNDGYRDGHYYYAGDTEDLEAAIAEILQSIQTKIGYEDVKITDGITDATATTTVHGDTSDFTYTITDPNGVKYVIELDGSGKITSINGSTTTVILKDDADNTLELAVGGNFPGASNADGTVTWDIGSLGLLLNNFTYQVSFVVWPSQEAYDTIAECYNDPTYWTSHEAELEAAGYTRTGSGTAADPYGYTLKTNTNARVDYTSVTKVTGQDDVKESGFVDYGDVPAMELTTTSMNVTKEWLDTLSTEDRPEAVTLYVGYDENGDGVIDDKDTNAEPVTLDESNGWTQTVYIAPGIIVKPGDYKTPTTGENAGVLETGHVYMVSESAYKDEGKDYEGMDPHYELESDPIQPMVNGLTTTDTDDLMDFISKTNWADGIAKLKASNVLKGGININKIIDVDDANKPFVNEDQEFTFTVKLFDKDGNPVSTTGSSTESGALGYRIFWGDPDKETERGDIVNGQVVLKITAADTIRIVNVPSGAYYTVEEGDLSATVYEFKQSDWLTRYKETEDSDWIIDDSETVTDSQITNTHKIVMNAENNVTFTNTYVGTGYVATKIWEDDNYPERPKTIVFQLYQKVSGSEDEPVAYGDPVTVGLDEQGNPLDGTTVVDNNTWTYTWKGLPSKELVDGTVVTYEYSFEEVSVLDEYFTTQEGSTVTNTLRRKVQFVKLDMESTEEEQIIVQGAVFTVKVGDETYTMTSNEEGILETADGTSILYLPYGDNVCTLTEEDVPAGYNKLKEPVNVSVHKDSQGKVIVSYIYEYAPDEVEEIKDPTDNTITYIVKIRNSTGMELPHSGGPGTFIYTLGGAALIMASALMYGFRMRRRERRLN